MLLRPSDGLNGSDTLSELVSSEQKRSVSTRTLAGNVFLLALSHIIFGLCNVEENRAL